MAVLNDIIVSLVEAIAALNSRVAELAAAQPVAGPQGEQGPPGQDGKDAPAVSEAEIKAAAAEWLAANITQPADGADGQDGAPGRAPTADEISLAVDVWFELNRDQLTGKDGKDGKDGRDGQDGRNGVDGRDGSRGAVGPTGVGIATIEQRKAGEFTVRLTDGKEFTIKLPASGLIRSAGGGGGGGAAAGGIRAVTSNDGSVSVTLTDNVVDLSVPATASTATVIATVRNRTGSTIPKGAAVYISGATGQTSTISLALATSDATSAQTLGLTAAAIGNNQVGSVIVIGYLSDVNTSAFTDGQQLYLSPTVPGGFTATKPHAPNHIVYVAVVEYAHQIHGKLFVKVQNGYELDEIHDVQIVSPGAGHLLQYDVATDLWKNTATLGAQNGGTGASSLTGYLKGTGTDAFQGVAGIPASDISTPIDCGTFA
jgi:hypothetical protein